MSRIWLILSLLLASNAIAAPIELDDEEVIGLDDEDEDQDVPEEADGPKDADRRVVPKEDAGERFDLLDEDDEGMKDFTKLPPPAPTSKAIEVPKAPSGPTRISLDASGKQPLTDVFPASIIALDEDVVVVQLPILVATKPDDLEPGYLYGDFYLGTNKLAEVRVLLDKSGTSIFGATFAWLQATVPVQTPTGSIEIVVRHADPREDNARELFRTKVAYALK